MWTEVYDMLVQDRQMLLSRSWQYGLHPVAFLKGITTAKRKLEAVI